MTMKEAIIKLILAKGIFTGADLGLIKYHFEPGAGIENFHWKNNSQEVL